MVPAHHHPEEPLFPSLPSFSFVVRQTQTFQRKRLSVPERAAMQRHLSDTCGTFSGSVWGMEILGNKEKSGCYLQGCRKSQELPETTRRAVLTSPAGWSPHLGPGPGVRKLCVNRRISLTWMPGGCPSSRDERELGNDFIHFDLFCCCHLNIKRGQGWPS